MPLMSKRAYARAHNVDEKTVRKAIASGKIPMVGGMIDSDLADACWARNRDGGQHSKLAAAAPVRVHTEERPAAEVLAEAPASVAPQQPALEMAPLTQARIENTKESTLLKEIARRKLERDLLDAEEVERTWGQLLQTVKDRLRLIPDDVAPAVLACATEEEVRSILTREILNAFGAISKALGDMAAA